MHRQNGASNRHMPAKRGTKLGEKRRETAETGEIVGGELQQWSQLPNESAAAYAGFTAYADLRARPANDYGRIPCAEGENGGMQT